jgi:hypothetical protein
VAELKIKIEAPPEEPAQQQTQQPDKAVQPVNKNSIKMEMKIRRSLDGNAMIYDHDNIDIVVSPKKLKVVAFAKGDFSDFVYAAQNRLFEFMVKKGIIDPQTIKGGHVYGSIEGTILKPLEENIPLDQIVILNIGKWIEEERPHMEFDRQYEEEFTDHMTDPDDEEGTDLGEVPQEEEKGSMSQMPIRRYTGY